MPYYRKRRFYRKRRYNNKRKFSRYTTYKNRGSKAQAAQIYALNRRINRIESRTKPEILEFVPTPQGRLINPPATEGDINKWTSMNVVHITDLGSDFGYKMVNQSVRVNKIIIWGAFERNFESVMAHDNVSCGYVRFAVVQYPAERYVNISSDDIFNLESGTAGFTSPLKKGCGSHCKILKVVNIKISSTDPITKTFKFTIYPKYKIVHKSLDAGGQVVADQRMKGGICIVPVGFMETNNTNSPSTYHLTLESKALYVDN